MAKLLAQQFGLSLAQFVNSVNSSISIRGGFFYVSRRFASIIHESSDLKKALVLSLRAECTMLRDQKKLMCTRGTRNGYGFRSALEKNVARYRIIVNVGTPCAQFAVWSSWLSCSTKRSTSLGTKVLRLRTEISPIELIMSDEIILSVRHGTSHCVSYRNNICVAT